MAEKNYDELSREELVKKVGELDEQNLSLQERIAQIEGEKPVESTEETNNAEQKNANEVDPRVKRRFKDYLAILRNVCVSLLVAAAVVVLVVNFAFPVMRIYGSSMSSTLVDGDIVISRKTTELERGDICAFYSGNRVLCKRVIALGGDVVSIDREGVVSVNGEVIDEPYLKGRSLGDCDVEFPMTVPEDTYFVLGDNRRVSIDSRNTAVGCVSEEQVVGRIFFCVLPFPSFGKIE